MSGTLILTVVCLFALTVNAGAQKKTAPQQTAPKTLKKSNQRTTSAAPQAPKPEPFEKATAAEMASKCVKLETEAGIIEMELFPESAPQTVRNFLNLVSLGAFDTTTFSRVVPNFVIQGGSVGTRDKVTPELIKRAQQTIPDEPSQIKHERGIVSMARSDEPNSASSHFFILVGAASNLDGKFAAFGRVTKGMEVVESINKMPVEAEKPVKPVRLTRAVVISCEAPQTTVQ
jgi:peptidyl-prolyl cis-trans isomerase B (cyclophilin B)